jgi:glycosyltransferase involved in cell wall biosynthesis
VVDRRSAEHRAGRPSLALLPWGLLIEDFLTPNRLSLADFCESFVGSWMFGYVEALQTSGVDTVIACVSGEVRATSYVTHRPTGARILLMPAPPAYRLLRRRMSNPYGRSTAGTFGKTPAAARPILATAKEAAPYLATPLVRLFRELRRLGCGAVLCQEYEFPRFDGVVALGRLLRIPVFASFQGGDYQRWAVERLLRPASVRAASGLIIPGARERRRVRSCYGVAPERIAAIPNPIDTAIWKRTDRAAAREAVGLPQDAEVVAWHGRISVRKKGLDLLVDAWVEILRRRRDRQLVLLLVGTGPDRDELRTWFAERSVEGVVWVDRYVHDRSQIVTLLSCADVYAFPSRQEGFPVAPVEAMACGLPVVATDAHGVREILGDGAADRGAGVVVPVDDAAGFAAELGRLLDDHQRRHRMAVQARRRAEEAFSLSAVGRQLRGLLFASTAADG